MHRILHLLPLLAAQALHVLAAPAPADPVITPAPKRPLIVRQDGSTDFGTEVLTGTFGTAVQTFTIHHGVALANTGGSGEDEDVTFANDGLVSMVKGIARDTSLCNGRTDQEKVKRRSDIKYRRQNIGDGSPAHANELEKRAPPVLENLDLGECTSARVRNLLEQMDQPDAVANQLIIMAEDAQGLRELAEGTDDAVELLNALANEQAVFIAIPAPNRVRRIRSTVQIALLFVRAFELGLEIGRELVIQSKNFNTNPDKAESCGVDKDAPACPDQSCQGDPETKKCTVDPIKDCTCYNIVEAGLGWAFDAKRFDQQQDILKEFAPTPEFPNNPPKCNGLGTTTYATVDAIADAIDDFCSQSFVGDPNKPGPSKKYNENKPNWLEFRVDWKAAFTMAGDECRVLFKTISDGCDGNQPVFNPHNVKHGGVIEHPKGAILRLTPKSGSNPQCEGPSYDNKNWIDRDAAKIAATEFCTGHTLKNKAGEQATQESTVWNSYKVTVGALWIKDFNLEVQDCIDQLVGVAVDGCNGNDPINNPTNKKYGAPFLNQDGVLLALVPTNKPSEYPPDEKDTKGNIIEPKCNDGDRNIWPPPEEMEKAINDFCVDGHDFGTGKHSWRSGFVQLKIEISAKEVDAQSTYQQGQSVCRHNQDFGGKIKASDCKEAISRMNKKCDKDAGWWGSNYDYNCVHYSVQTNYDFGQ